MTIKTYNLDELKAVEWEGNRIWQQIYKLIKGKRFPNFDRVTISVPFNLDSYEELRIAMANYFLSQGKIRLFLRNSQEVKGLNLNNGLLSPIEANERFADVLEIKILRTKVLKKILPIIKSLAPILTLSREEKG